MEQISQSPFTLPGVIGTFRPAVVFAEAFSVEEHLDARWAKFEITEGFLLQILRLQAVCKENKITDLRVFAGPGQWDQEERWRPDVPHLHISGADFWYQAVPKYGDGMVQTQAIPIEPLLRLLAQHRTGENDRKDFKWINGVLYFSGSDAELLAEDVAETV